jgi:hypothetical protein
MDVPESIYHNDPLPEPSASRSILKTILERTPKHARHDHPRLNPDYEKKDDSKFDLGSAVHSTLLKRGKNIVEIAAPDYRTDKAKMMRDAARAANKIPLLSEQVARVDDMNTAILAQLPDFGLERIFNPEFGQPEVMAAWVDPVGGWSRILIDWLEKDLTIWDLKTTDVPISPETIGRHMSNMGYEWQDGLYKRGVEHLFPELAGRVKFNFLFVEAKPPYVILPVRLPNDAVAKGKSNVEKAMKMWAKCKSENKWPAFSGDIRTAEYPPWAIAEYQEVTG